MLTLFFMMITILPFAWARSVDSCFGCNDPVGVSDFVKGHLFAGGRRDGKHLALLYKRSGNCRQQRQMIAASFHIIVSEMLDDDDNFGFGVERSVLYPLQLTAFN